MVKSELTEQFGGLTAYSRSPAEGLWRKGDATQRETIIIYEVMTERRDMNWWRRYRSRLEKRFRQERVVIRKQRIRLV